MDYLAHAIGYTVVFVIFVLQPIFCDGMGIFLLVIAIRNRKRLIAEGMATDVVAFFICGGLILAIGLVVTHASFGVLRPIVEAWW